MRSLGGRLTGMAAGLIFLTSYHPLRTATLPMAEAWSYAFLVWSLWLLAERRHVALGLVFLLGLSCKETTLLVLPALYKWFAIPTQSEMNSTADGWH